jgi:hypothetical protein
MTNGDWFLVLVLAAFAVLGGALAFVSWDEDQRVKRLKQMAGE